MLRRTLTLSPEAQAALEAVRDHHPKAWARERASALLKIAAGQSAHAVARTGLLKPRDPDALYRWLKSYLSGGLPKLLTRLPSRRRFSPL